MKLKRYMQWVEVDRKGRDGDGKGTTSMFHKVVLRYSTSIRGKYSQWLDLLTHLSHSLTCIQNHLRSDISAIHHCTAEGNTR